MPRFPPWLGAISLMVLLSAALMPPALAEEHSTVRILILGETKDYPEEFINAVSGYGDVTVSSIRDASEYSVDYLTENFDLFVVSASSHSEYGYYWTYDYGVSLSGKIWQAVESGKSLIAVTYGTYSSPANAVASITKFSTPKEFVKYTVVSNDLTQDVKSIECGDVSYFIYGRYPLVLTPKKSGYPENPGALAIYGTYGKGKYAVVSSYLYSYSCRGDIGQLTSNILYWLTNREIPAPLTLNNTIQQIRYINESVNTLYSDLQTIREQIEEVKQESQNIAPISNKIDALESRLEDDEKQLNELSAEIKDLRKQLENLRDRVNSIETRTPSSEIGSDKKSSPTESPKKDGICGTGLLAGLSVLVLLLRRK